MLELISVDGITQWDVGRQVKVDKDVDMVHFSNRPYGYSKNVKVTDGVADVPDMFLTSCAPLRIWAYVGDFEKGYTKIEKIYEIKPKNRPEDYIYTPEEVKTWEKLQDEIGDLADLATNEKSNLVAALNEVTRSGGGGGAYTLPQATASVLGGVKADPATASDTQPVRIGKDGKLVTAAGAGGKNSKVESWDGMELLASGTVASGTAAGTITDTGVTYGAFKQWHRVIFLRRCASEQGTFSNGYGAGNNAGFRNALANLSVTLEHIDGYLWKYWCHATNTAPYAVPTTEIQELTGTLWTPAISSTTNCDIVEGYIDIRINNKNSFSDSTTFVIKNWAALTADVSWYIYGLTKEVTQ